MLKISTSDSFEKIMKCSVCGEFGHIRTKKECPYYYESDQIINGISPAKQWKTSYESGRKYSSEWEIKYPWCKESPDSSGKALCKVCNVTIYPKIHSLKMHQETTKHKKQNSKPPDSESPGSVTSLDRNVIKTPSKTTTDEEKTADLHVSVGIACDNSNSEKKNSQVPRNKDLINVKGTKVSMPKKYLQHDYARASILKDPKQAAEHSENRRRLLMVGRRGRLVSRGLLNQLKRFSSTDKQQEPVVKQKRPLVSPSPTDWISFTAKYGENEDHLYATGADQIANNIEIPTENSAHHEPYITRRQRSEFSLHDSGNNLNFLERLQLKEHNQRMKYLEEEHKSKMQQLAKEHEARMEYISLQKKSLTIASQPQKEQTNVQIDLTLEKDIESSTVIT